MGPTSTDSWSHQTMPEKLTIDFLLPNGILLPMICHRDMTLSVVKGMLWRAAKGCPLYDRLQAPSNYIFLTIGSAGEKEEFYDDSRRLCDLHIFIHVLSVVEPRGNRRQKQLDQDIGVLLGHSLSEYEKGKDSGLTVTRCRFFDVAAAAVRSRRSNNPNQLDLFCVPEELAPPSAPPPPAPAGALKAYMVCVWLNACANPSLANSQSRVRGGQKLTVKLDLTGATPDHLIREIIRRRDCRPANNQQQQVLAQADETQGDGDDDCVDEFVLKVVGCQLYLIRHVPLLSFKYIRECVSHDQVPLLMLMSRKAVLREDDVSWEMLVPAYVKRQPSLCISADSDSQSLWALEAMLRVRVNTASRINITDVDQIYVKVAVFHGPDLIEVRETARMPPSNPRWNEILEFELYMKDIPRSAQVCFGVCSVRLRKGKDNKENSRKVSTASMGRRQTASFGNRDSFENSQAQQKEQHNGLAWANVRLIDDKDRCLDDRLSLYMWPYPRGFDGYEMLNPLGQNGSNANREAARLDVEFECFDRRVKFPSTQEVDEFARFTRRWEHKERPERRAVNPQNITKPDRVALANIVQRGPLIDMSEEEKDCMWRLRDYCCVNEPDALPRLLDAVRWSRRQEVAQVYVLLGQWGAIGAETALELLDVKYPDPLVRSFAVRTLDKTFDDERLSLYLMSLVQVLKYEAFVDNDLAQLLLKRALLSRRVGHTFFWLLRAELARNEPSAARFGLLLEAFCRGAGPYLRSLLRQADAVDKLECLGLAIQERKDDAHKFLHEELRHHMEVLQNFESPIDAAHILGSLQLSDCRVLNSAKKPLWLAWQNPDPLAELTNATQEIIFKSGDDLRQDMLTLQVLRIMESIWRDEGKDFCLTPYTCLPMGRNIGMIEVVKRSKTIHEIQGKLLYMDNAVLNKWIRERNLDEKRYADAVDRFTRSCAGYCVATFVLGIKDRHTDNIMVTDDGRIFHIDFGHFLGHYKKKLGINRDRVPFVLTDLFLAVIAKGASNPRESEEFKKFQELCGEAYMMLRRHSHLFISLFTMMLCMGIPELQRLEDVEYVRRTLGADLSDQRALDYFQTQLNDAYEGAWTTNVNWFFHSVRRA